MDSPHPNKSQSDEPPPSDSHPATALSISSPELTAHSQTPPLNRAMPQVPSCPAAPSHPPSFPHLPSYSPVLPRLPSPSRLAQLDEFHVFAPPIHAEPVASYDQSKETSSVPNATNAHTSFPHVPLPPHPPANSPAPMATYGCTAHSAPSHPLTIEPHPISPIPPQQPLHEPQPQPLQTLILPRRLHEPVPYRILSAPHSLDFGLVDSVYRLVPTTDEIFNPHFPGISPNPSATVQKQLQLVSRPPHPPPPPASRFLHHESSVALWPYVWDVRMRTPPAYTAYDSHMALTAPNPSYGRIGTGTDDIVPPLLQTEMRERDAGQARASEAGSQRCVVLEKMHEGETDELIMGDARAVDHDGQSRGYCATHADEHGTYVAPQLESQRVTRDQGRETVAAGSPSGNEDLSGQGGKAARLPTLQFALPLEVTRGDAGAGPGPGAVGGTNADMGSPKAEGDGLEQLDSAQRRREQSRRGSRQFRQKKRAQRLEMGSSVSAGRAELCALLAEKDRLCSAHAALLAKMDTARLEDVATSEGASDGSGAGVDDGGIDGHSWTERTWRAVADTEARLLGTIIGNGDGLPQELFLHSVRQLGALVRVYAVQRADLGVARVMRSVRRRNDETGADVVEGASALAGLSVVDATRLRAAVQTRAAERLPLVRGSVNVNAMIVPVWGCGLSVVAEFAEFADAKDTP